MTTMTTALEQKLDTLYDYYEQAFGKSRLSRENMKVAFENGMKKGAKGINLFPISCRVGDDGNETFRLYADVFTNKITAMEKDNGIWKIAKVLDCEDDDGFVEFIKLYGSE